MFGIDVHFTTLIIIIVRQASDKNCKYTVVCIRIDIYSCIALSGDLNTVKAKNAVSTKYHSEQRFEFSANLKLEYVY